VPVVAAATVETLVQYGDLNAWLDGEDYTRHSDVTSASPSHSARRG